MLVPARLGLRRTARTHSAPNVSLTSGRPCSALGLLACPSPSKPRPCAPHSRPEVRAISKTPKGFQKVAQGKAAEAATLGNARRSSQFPSPPLEERGQGRGGHRHCGTRPSSRTGKSPSGSLADTGATRGEQRQTPAFQHSPAGRQETVAGGRFQARQATELRAGRLHSALLRSGSRS